MVADGSVPADARLARGAVDHHEIAAADRAGAGGIGLDRDRDLHAARCDGRMTVLDLARRQKLAGRDARPQLFANDLVGGVTGEARVDDTVGNAHVDRADVVGLHHGNPAPGRASP